MADISNNMLGKLGSRVFNPTDSAEQRLHKTLLIFACGLMGFAAMLWLLIYHAMGINYSATVPLVYITISATTLAIYLWKLNFEFFRLAQTSLNLFVPFIMQWAIGNYVTSSGVMLWALIAPVGVMIFQGPKQSIPWFFAYIVMTAVSGFFDYYLGYHDTTMGVPLQTISVFFVLNFAAMSTIVYLLIIYSVREKDRLKAGIDEQHRLVKIEQERSERLLLNVLPGYIADRLKREPGVIADGIADCTIMFADLTDFTRLTEEMPPREMVGLLNEIFSWFDLLAENYGLEKIKTVGDAYMVVGGLLDHPEQYTEAVANMAIEIRDKISMHRTRLGESLDIHIGIGTGPVVGGVIGVKKFIYDLWGNPVNMASRLCTEGASGGILVDTTTYKRLQVLYRFEGPESLIVKGHRQITAYRLITKLHEMVAERPAAAV